jgi:hypothetical protein
MLIDTSFIYALFVFAVIALVIGFFGSYKIFQWLGGFPAKQILQIRKKAQSVIFQLAPNNLWRFIPVVSKWGNVWNTPEGSITVTPQHIHPTVGLAQSVIEYTLSADPNEAFVFYATQLAGKDKSASPPQLNEIVTFLKKREAALTDIIEAVNAVKSNRMTLNDAVIQIMEKRAVPPIDGVAYHTIAQRLSAALNDGMGEYLNELGRVKEALKITVQPKAWEFETNAVGDIVNVVSNETLEADDFMALTPAGTVNDVQTVSQRNEAVAVKESQFTMNTAMKYITIGVVIFIALVSLAFFLKSQGL